jgi:hypothetical protein
MEYGEYVGMLERVSTKLEGVEIEGRSIGG